MTTRRVAAALVGAITLLGGLTACEDQADTRAPEPPAADSVRPAELEPAWRVGELRDVADGVTQGRLRAWVSDDRLVLLGGRSAVAIDPATGERLWRAAAVPGWGRICGAADEPGQPIGTVLFGKGSACTSVAALDLEKGRFAWRHDTGADVRSVTAGKGTVAAVTACGQVSRWRLDGEALRPLARRSKACAHESAVAGSLAVVRAARTLTAYDVTDRSRVWRTASEPHGAELFGVASVDPLVLDESAKGHRTLTRRGPEGDPQSRVGLTMGEDAVFTPIAREGALVLGRYGDRTLAAYDLGSGETLWSRPADDYTRAIGLSGGRVLLSRVVAVADHPDGEVWVGAQRLAGRQSGLRLLGRLPAPPAGAEVSGTLAAGDRLYVLTGARLTAYDVPSGGEPVEAFPDAYDAAALPEGDLTPESASDACRAVDEKALAALGFRDLTVPPPADCRWTERFDPADVSRTLVTRVTALPPTADDTAWTAAARLEDRRLDARAAEGDAFGRLSGFTDDAWIASSAAPDGSGTRATLVARYRNAVIEVHGVQDAARHGTNAELVAPDASSRGVVAAARSILTSLGTKAPAPEQPTGTPVAKAPDVCELAGAAGASLVAGAEREPTTPRESDGTFAGCLWARELAVFPELLVTAYAVPGGLDGSSAVDRARLLYAADGDDPRVRGLGDEAKVWGFRPEKADEYGVRVVTARRGNLIVNVSLAMKSTDSDITKQAVGVARQVLDGTS